MNAEPIREALEAATESWPRVPEPVPTIEDVLHQWDRLDNAIKSVQTAQLCQVSQEVALLEQEREEMAVLIKQLGRAWIAVPQR